MASVTPGPHERMLNADRTAVLMPLAWLSRAICCPRAPRADSQRRSHPVTVPFAGPVLSNPACYGSGEESVRWCCVLRVSLSDNLEAVLSGVAVLAKLRCVSLLFSGFAQHGRQLLRRLARLDGWTTCTSSIEILLSISISSTRYASGCPPSTRPRSPPTPSTSPHWHRTGAIVTHRQSILEFDNTYTMAYGTDPDPYGAIPP